MTLNRNKILAENAKLKAELKLLKVRHDNLDLQRRLLLDQLIGLKVAAEDAGIEFVFRTDDGQTDDRLD